MPDINCAILLTAPGVSAIAVIRLAGPAVQSFLAGHFSRPVRPDAAVHGRLTSGSTELDDPLVILGLDGQTADVCTHGGLWVVHSVLDLAAREGFQVLSPLPGQPLPEMAVDARDIIEQEILQYLPQARTHEAIQTLLAQRKAWETPPAPDILNDRSLHWLLHPPQVAIVGLPNSGKSTLANALFGQSRSIVADLPGTTRDYVEDFANLSGLAIRLIDTPGIHLTADAIEMAAINISRSRLEHADLHILLLDPTQPQSAQEPLIAEFPRSIIVSGKCDLAPAGQGLAVSAKTGAGLSALDLAIRRHFHCQTLPHSRPAPWTPRQERLLAGNRSPDIGTLGPA